MIKNKLEYEKMAEAEEKLWWYKSLHNLVLKNIRRNFEAEDIKILDAGCGTGGLLDFLKSNNFNNLEGFDICEYAVNHCKARDLNVIQGNIIKTDKIKESNSYNVIVSNDTFYFFSSTEERKDILNQFYNVLKKDGIVILNLPSLKAFRGTHDIAVGCPERFDIDQIKKMIDISKFSIQTMLFWPFLLSPIIFMVRFLQRIKLNNKQEKIESDVKMPSKFVNDILYKIVEFENKYLGKKPFGSSIFLVLKKL